jgi:hypothetical protein
MATLHHKDQEASEPTTMQHVCVFLGIAVCVAALIYFS